jgi:tetratricopeptide (TPR) repeat protein
MPSPSLRRIRKGRLIQILLVYLGISWVILQVVGELRGLLSLPDWIGPVTLILLAVGLIIMLATAWVQSHPLVEVREQTDDVPGSWELDVGDAVRTLRRGRLPHLTWGRALVGGVVAFSLLFGVAGFYVLIRSDAPLFAPGSASGDVAPDGIAVLPFTVRGAGLEEWRESMVELLSTGLDGAAGMRALASRTVLARWHAEAPAEADADVALGVARRLGARYAVLGSAVAIGPEVRLVADVREILGDGARSLGQAQEQGHPDSVLVLVDRLSVGVLRLVLEEGGAGMPRVDLASITTSSLPALKSYLEGEAAFRRSDFPSAIAAWERAVALDSTFGLAYTRLAQAYGWNESVASARGREAGNRAFALLDRLPPREALLARASYHMRRDELEAIALLEEAVAKYPDHAEAWYQLGDAYYHMNSALVGREEIVDALERAVALAPHVASYHIHLLDVAFGAADSAAVHRHLAGLRRLAPSSPQTRRYTLAAQLVFGTTATRDSLVDIISAELVTDRGLGPVLSRATFHPRLLSMRDHFVSPVEVPAAVRPIIARDMGWARLWSQGRIRAALEWFRDPALDPQEQSQLVLDSWLAGIPVPQADVDQAVARIHVTGGQAFTAGSAAARQQRWDTHAAAVSTLRGRADSILAAGDTLEARQDAVGVRILEGYALWQRGRPEDALTILETARRDSPLELVRWWIAMIHFDAGRYVEAEPYLRSFGRWDPDPISSYYLGVIYEATQRPQEARSRLAFFVESWSGADPELQPLVEDARARLARLGAES